MLKTTIAVSDSIRQIHGQQTVNLTSQPSPFLLGDANDPLQTYGSL